jgi:hypothetical protein
MTYNQHQEAAQKHSPPDIIVHCIENFKTTVHTVS